VAGFCIDGDEITGSKKEEAFLDHLSAFWPYNTHPAA
jgi:hypothetical protein